MIKCDDCGELKGLVIPYGKKRICDECLDHPKYVLPEPDNTGPHCDGMRQKKPGDPDY
jgi:hypothetical protein